MTKRIYILLTALLISAQLTASDWISNHPIIAATVAVGSLLGAGVAGGTVTHCVENAGTNMAAAAADNLQERAEDLVGGLQQAGGELIALTGNEIVDNILPATEKGLNSLLETTGKQLCALVSTTNTEAKSLLTHTNGEVMPLLSHTNEEVKTLLTHTNGEVKSLLTHTNGEVKTLLTHTNGEVKSLLTHTNGEVKSLSTHLNNELKSTFTEGIKQLDATSEKMVAGAAKESRSLVKSFFIAGLCSAVGIMGLKFFYDGFQEYFAEGNDNNPKTKPMIKMGVGGACFAAAMFGVYKQFE